MRLTSDGYLGLGTTTPLANLTIEGNSGQTANLFAVASSSGKNLFVITEDGTVGISSSTPQGMLTLDKDSINGAGVYGIKEYFNFVNSVESDVLYADNAYIVNAPTATSTLVGKMLRIEDSTTLGNTVRGLEVQAHRGTNTQGENTALSGIARTFGVRGITEGDAGGTYYPAGVFAQTRGTTQGNAFRAYSSTITTADLVSIFQDTSDFSGTGLLMNFGNSGGSFATSSNYIDLQMAGVSKFTVSAHGTTTIGDGTTNNMAGLQIGYGGLCVDNDGSCVASTTGRISSVSSYTGNSDLAETYFSNEDLEPGEIIYSNGGLSILRANKENERKIIGVVSTKPGLLLGADDSSLKEGEKKYPVALSGRVPIKVSTEGGVIKAGDRIALSSIPGIGSISTTSGVVVGIALEDFDGTHAYSEGFVNQFGDDIADPVYTPVYVSNDPRINDGCYYGAGADLGDADEKECVPVDEDAEGLDMFNEINEEIAREANERALQDLLEEEAMSTTTEDGKEVRVGEILMFVDVSWDYLSDSQEEELFGELFATSTTREGEEQTLWEKLKDIADRFVDGILVVFKLKAYEVEVTQQLCIDDVCVTADDLRQLLQNANSGSGDDASDASGSEGDNSGGGGDTSGGGEGGANGDGGGTSGGSGTDTDSGTSTDDGTNTGTSTDDGTGTNDTGTSTDDGTGDEGAGGTGGDGSDVGADDGVGSDTDGSVGSDDDDSVQDGTGDDTSGNDG
jgi:hypothetical protein